MRKTGNKKKHLLFFLITLILIISSKPTWPEEHIPLGRKLYQTICSPCHGIKGKGDGSGARFLPIKPGDHTNGAKMNNRPDKEIIDIISKGGSAMGKAPYMPAWGNVLSEKQILELVSYIRSLAIPPYKTPRTSNQ